MANSDKDILITPNINQSDVPKIEFTGYDNSTITLSVESQDFSTAGYTTPTRLEIKGSVGILYSIGNNLSTGTIFAAVDEIGTPLIEALADGTTKIGASYGDVYVGNENGKVYLTNDNRDGYTATDNTSVISTVSNNRVFVEGSIQLRNDNDAYCVGRGTGSFFRDEEIAFGWGGGWYMQDATYLRSRNDKTVYSGGRLRTDYGLRVGGDGTNDAYSVDTSGHAPSNSGSGNWAQTLKYNRFGGDGWHIGNHTRSFYVGGTSGNYYPIMFVSNTWPGNSTNKRIRIQRQTVHSNGPWRGTFSWELTFHPSNWGHWGNQYAYGSYYTGNGGPYNDPLGNFFDGATSSGGSELIVYLKGGCTYWYDAPDLSGGYYLYPNNAMGDTDPWGTGTPGAIRTATQRYPGRTGQTNPITSQDSKITYMKNRFFGFSNGIGGYNVYASGTVSGATKNFKIKHPVLENKYLVHGSVEGPRFDLIYRGTATLAGGTAILNLDEDQKMSPGTFAALCRDPQVWVANDTGWSPCQGTVSGGTLTITCNDTDSTDTVSYLVIAERQDDVVKSLEITDDEGRLILEPDADGSVPEVIPALRSGGLQNAAEEDRMNVMLGGLTEQEVNPYCCNDPQFTDGNPYEGEQVIE